MTQKQLASEVGVIPFRVNDYIIARYIQLSFLDFAQDENVHKWEFSARKRALNEELRMMNEEWQRNSPPSGRRSPRRGRW